MTTQRRNLLIAAGVAVLILVLWFVLLWRPQTDRLESAREREQVAADQNAQLELELARLRSAAERRNELVASQERLRSAIPEDPQLAQFILDANDAATASGVDFLSISPTPPSPSETPGVPSVVALSITVDGGYFQVLDYMNRMNTMERIVVIDTINTSPGGDEGGGRLSVSISARMFTTATDIDVIPVEPEAGPSPDETTTTVEGEVPAEVEGDTP